MMSHLEIGKLGENLAAEYLQNKGYQILRQNFRAGKGEIDLIAQTPEGCLVFVEVKTRALDGFGGPEEAVDRKKQDIIARTAGSFMEQIGHEGELRFDIISVLLAKGQLKNIRHVEDAFF
ncbi:MAG: YraN family protein [Lewinellaceae bacterium]|nr:YraN family protein [Saprospiraceae bacterium]MCB9330768.1 YraN family protein [Lewinellaceae bacterium]